MWVLLRAQKSIKIIFLDLKELFLDMGSRPETNVFIRKMTESNTIRLQKLNENKLQPNLAYGPFALCNRHENVTPDEQKDMLMKMYNELVHYVMKVSQLLRLVQRYRPLISY